MAWSGAVTHHTTSSDGTTGAQTRTSASFTPTANSLLWVFAEVEGDTVGGSVTPAWGISNTGGLTFTKHIESTYVSGAYYGTLVAWRAVVGASPSAMTVTVDPYTGTTQGWISLSAFDVTGIDLTSPVVQAAEEHVTSGSPGSNISRTTDVVLGSAPSSGNLLIAAFAGSSDSSVPGTPTSFTSIGSVTAPYEGMRTSYRTGTTQTTVTSTFTCYWQSGIVIELAEYVDPFVPAVPPVAGVVVGSSTSHVGAAYVGDIDYVAPGSSGLKVRVGGSWVTPTAVKVRVGGGVPSGSLFWDFTQSDGAPTGWTGGVAAQDLTVVSNKLSTAGSTTLRGGAYTHALTLDGDFEINAVITHPKIVGHGGVNVWLIDGATGNGWGFFVGNSLHIQKVTGGTQSNLTNDGVPGEGTSGVITQTYRLRRVGTTISSWAGGVQVASITDAAYSNVGDTIFVTTQNTQAPTYETTLDDLMVSDSTGVTYPPTGSSWVTAAVKVRVGGAWVAV